MLYKYEMQNGSYIVWLFLPAEEKKALEVFKNNRRWQLFLAILGGRG